ncbi:MAG: hypothetical protein KF729_24150 [Sandaracinaceae bacterium]|nr:hypothetical protein [Sandaracinaceae bacterium]
MTRGRAIRTFFAIGLAAHVITVLAAIALLARMSPAIGQILDANERSVHEAERMLAALTRPVASPEDRATYFDALGAAEQNVTEGEEPEVLARLRAAGDDALDGDVDARVAVVRDLLRLSEINRTAMRGADARALRLGLAGRWALALLGVIGIFASAWALRRAQHQVLDPVEELVAVLDARARGDRHRRYSQTGSSALASALARIDELLDALDAPRPGEAGAGARALSAAVAHLLDATGRPILLAASDGRVVAASVAALDRLAADGAQLRAALRAGALEPWAEAVELVGDGELRVVTLRAEPL